VDVNVRRVLGRVVAGAHDGLGAAAMQHVADAAVPVDHPGEWTHALMDIGAMVCRPRAPRCADCPLRPWCRYAAGDRPAADTTSPRATRERATPFASTNRWLRGRIMTRLRAVAGDAWAVVDAEIGAHDGDSVRRAVLDLDRDGLVETRDRGGRLEARLRRD
jgi:A/G-specific adenine glycosylase